MTDFTEPVYWPIGTLATADEINALWGDNLKHIRETISGPFPFTVDPRNYRASGIASSATRCWYARVRGLGDVSKIYFSVSVATGNVSGAVYSNTGSGRSARPNSRLATSGSVACPAAGSASVTLGATVTVDLPHGENWFAFSTSSTATLYGTGAAYADSNLGAGLAYRENVHPAPATATATPTAIINPPMLVGGT